MLLSASQCILRIIFIPNQRYLSLISSPLLRFLPSAAPLKYSFVRPPTTTNPPFPPPLETLLNRAAAIQKLSEVGEGVGGGLDEGHNTREDLGLLMIHTTRHITI